MNRHRTATPQRGPSRSPPGTRHGWKLRQGHGNLEQAPTEQGKVCAGLVG